MIAIQLRLLREKINSVFCHVIIRRAVCLSIVSLDGLSFLASIIHFCTSTTCSCWGKPLFTVSSSIMYSGHQAYAPTPHSYIPAHLGATINLDEVLHTPSDPNTALTLISGSQACWQSRRKRSSRLTCRSVQYNHYTGWIRKGVSEGCNFWNRLHWNMRSPTQTIQSNLDRWSCGQRVHWPWDVQDKVGCNACCFTLNSVYADFLDGSTTCYRTHTYRITDYHDKSYDELCSIQLDGHKRHSDSGGNAGLHHFPWCLKAWTFSKRSTASPAFWCHTERQQSHRSWLWREREDRTVVDHPEPDEGDGWSQWRSSKRNGTRYEFCLPRI